MRVLDRYSKQLVPLSELKGSADFGRYVLVSAEAGVELTGEQGVNDLRLQLGLLETPSLRDFFLKTNEDVGAQVLHPPIIRNVSDRLILLPFEKLLEERLFHIEAAVRNPHTLLRRELEKVNVAAAKKIPPKSYEYIAGHTEDWEFRSVFAFKPRSVIHEILDVEYDLYENHALVSFIERTLGYLDKRLNETSNLDVFFETLRVLFDESESGNSWHRKLDRNLTLIGLSFEEMNQAGKLLRSTQKVLMDLRSRLARLFDNRSFKEVGRTRIHSPVLRETNVLVNHKHYRYLRQLWAELNIAHPEPSEEEKRSQDQRVYYGLVDFTMSLFHYSLKKHLWFLVDCKQRQIIAKHPKGEKVFPEMKVSLSKHRELILEFGDQRVEFVVIGNKPTVDGQQWFKESSGRKLLYLDLDNSSRKDQHDPSVVAISPYDADSTERIGSMLKGMMLRHYYKNLVQELEVPHGLREYLSIIKTKDMEFDTSGYKKFSFTGLADVSAPELHEWIEKVKLHPRFKESGRDKQSQIIEDVESFHQTLLKQFTFIRDEALFCFNDHCRKPLDPRSDQVSQFDYIKCNFCKSVVELKEGKLSFRIEEEKYAHLKEQDWGIDRISFIPFTG